MRTIFVFALLALFAVTLAAACAAVVRRLVHQARH
jgi:hypothetical protein